MVFLLSVNDVLRFDISVHYLFFIQIIQPWETILDDFAYIFTCMNQFIFHYIIQCPSGKILSYQVNQVVRFIKSIILYQIRMINLSKSINFVLQCLFTFELDFLPLIWKNFCCPSHFGILVLNQVNCCKGSSSKSFERLVKLVESFVRNASFEFLVNFLRFWNGLAS